MRKRKRVVSPSPTEGGQQFSPPVDISIEALAHATEGCRLIVEFVREQAGPDWRERGELLCSADGELRRARFWLAKEVRPRRQRSPVRRP